MASSTSFSYFFDNHVIGSLIPCCIIPNLNKAHLTGIGLDSINNFLCSPIRVLSILFA